MTFRRACSIFALSGLLAASAPAQLVITFDYSLDTSGFFGSPGSAQRDTLDQAAAYLSSFLTGQTMSAISPTYNGSTGTSWSSTQPNPSTGTNFTVGNPGVVAGPTLAANTINIYLGARDLAGSQIAFGAQGSWNVSATANFAVWDTLVKYRGVGTNLTPKMGSIAFDNNATPWYFDNDITTVESFTGQLDFFSVAVHELIHILGQFNGVGYTWTSKINGSNQFTGTASTTEFGGLIPLAGDLDHWADGTPSFIAGNPQVGGSQDTLMDPTFTLGVRKYVTDLDLAGLADMGYTTNQSTMLVNIIAVPEPSTYALFLGAGTLALAIWSRRGRLNGGKPAAPSGQSIRVSAVL